MARYYFLLQSINNYKKQKDELRESWAHINQKGISRMESDIPTIKILKSKCLIPQLKISKSKQKSHLFGLVPHVASVLVVKIAELRPDFLEQLKVLQIALHPDVVIIFIPFWEVSYCRSAQFKIELLLNIEAYLRIRRSDWTSLQNYWND